MIEIKVGEPMPKIRKFVVLILQYHTISKRSFIKNHH